MASAESGNRLALKLFSLLAGEGFANPHFSTGLLLKHILQQKLLRINAHVPWPVHRTSVISFPQRIDPGTRCPGLSPGCYIQGRNGIHIGANVWIGPGVGIISANHNLNDYSKHSATQPITIGNDCWLGMNAIILPGTQLGSHIVVAAGAVVTRSFRDNCVIAGNPAKIVKNLAPYGTGT